MALSITTWFARNRATIPQKLICQALVRFAPRQLRKNQLLAAIGPITLDIRSGGTIRYGPFCASLRQAAQNKHIVVISLRTSSNFGCHPSAALLKDVVAGKMDVVSETPNSKRKQTNDPIPRRTIRASLTSHRNALLKEEAFFGA